MLPPPPRRSLLRPVLLICALVAGLIGVLVVVDLADEPRRPQATPSFDYPILDVAPGASVPFAAPAAGDWAAQVAAKTDIPERTLRAYVLAEVRVRAVTPGCGLSWAILAGVGRIESHHGRFRGSAVGDDGRVSPPIVGVALDGSPGLRAIRDTDAGRLDGDQQWDRAVGAMQFLPSTWVKWGARAAEDGQDPDPQHVDDAALSAGKYLCASGGDLGTGKGWWKAVLAYNGSVAYGRDVFSAADAYGRLVAGLA